MNRARLSAVWYPALALLLLTACASGVPKGHPPVHGATPPTEVAEEVAAAPVAIDWQLVDAASPYRDLNKLEAGQIVHVPTGREVSFAQMMDVLADQRVVYVGEMHTNLEEHKAQLQVLESLAQRAKRTGAKRLMVGMEMFQQSAQPVLDEWVAGLLPEDEFLRTWYENWSGDFDYYRDILIFVRDHHIPLLALNANREQVKAVSSGEGLATEGVTVDRYQAAYMRAVLGGHGGGMGDRYLQVQTLWEESMAQVVIDALQQDDGAQVLVLAGSGHLQHGFGIPRKLFARLPVSYATVIPHAVTLPEGRDDLTMDVEVPDFPLLLADFSWPVEYADLEGQNITLGVQLDPQPNGLWIKAVRDGSPADEAGVKAGDLLLSLDGRPLPEFLDLKVALSLATPGTTGQLMVRRETTEMVLTVRYQTAASGAR